MGMYSVQVIIDRLLWKLRVKTPEKLIDGKRW
jgi:hypothetical protein